jgi:hypothetical protein
MKCRIQYVGDSLRITVCACYSWEITLIFVLCVSLYNTQDWKCIRKQAGEDYVTNDEISC